MASLGANKFGWIIFAIVAMALSGVFLYFAQKEIPIGVAYAIWTGIGVVGTIIFGIVLFKEPATLIKTKIKYNNKNLSAPARAKRSLGFTSIFIIVKIIAKIAKYAILSDAKNIDDKIKSIMLIKINVSKFLNTRLLLYKLLKIFCEIPSIEFINKKTTPQNRRPSQHLTYLNDFHR